MGRRPSPLRLLAGKIAHRQLLERGLQPDDISLLLGASGGPKWFVLAGLDEYLATTLLPARTAPLDLLGSSAGAWRMCALAQEDALSAIRRFAHSYSHLDYPAGSSRADVTRISKTLLEALLPTPAQVAEVLTNPLRRLHIVTARARHLTAHRHAPVQLAGIAAAATANAVNRQWLEAFFQRTLFHHPLAPPAVRWPQLSLTEIPLSAANLEDALFASGSIPLVLDGVRDIAGAPAGLYVDGGVTDYHFDLYPPLSGIVLYPHFYPYFAPGWFDKDLRRRTPSQRLERTLVLCPSPEMVARLPFAKIPDRVDFNALPHGARVRYWQRVIGESQRLAESFADRCARQDWADYLEPL